jgi:O-antigen/teichoic acid export membrane protein
LTELIRDEQNHRVREIDKIVKESGCEIASRGRLAMSIADTTGPSPRADAATRAGIARNASYLALGQIGTMVLGILLSAALGRALGARDFGQYFLAISSAAFAYVFVEWGQPILVIREAARDPQLAGELLGTALVLRVAAAAAVAIPLLLVALLLGYDGQTRWLLALYFVAALPMSLAQGFGMVFRASDRMDRDALVSVLNRGVGLALVVVALARGGGLVAVAVALFGAGLVSLGAARQCYAGLGAPPLAFTRKTARTLWIGGAPLILAGAASAVQPYLDVVILSKLVPSNAVGWYGAAKNILGTLLAPALILGAASFPQLSRTAAQPDRFREEVRASLRPMLLTGALGAAGTYLFADIAVRIIYGKAAYEPAVIILQVLSPAVFLLFVDILLGYSLVATGRTRDFAVVKIASVIVSTALDLVLIPWFQGHYGNGGMGVVAAFGLSELVVFAGAAALMPRGILGKRVAIDGAKALTAGAGSILLMRCAPGLPPAASIPLAILIFGVIALALGVVSRSDLALLGALARRRKTGAGPSADG